MLMKGIRIDDKENKREGKDCLEKIGSIYFKIKYILPLTPTQKWNKICQEEFSNCQSKKLAALIVLATTEQNEYSPWIILKTVQYKILNGIPIFGYSIFYYLFIACLAFTNRPKTSESNFIY